MKDRAVMGSSVANPKEDSETDEYEVEDDDNYN